MTRCSEVSLVAVRVAGAASCMPEQLYTQLAVIDATNYGRAAHSRATQYTMDAVERELNKAFVGFSRCGAPFVMRP
eukprot:486406-Pleurochrysis_carterae.AAC.1